MATVRKSRAGRGEPHDARPRPIRSQVLEKSTDVFITLVSILIGVVFADTVQEARARMHLWPLDLAAFITWGQLSALTFAGLTAWALYAHFGIARRTVPWYGETLVAAYAPAFLLLMNSYTGRDEFWPWLFAAAAFCIASIAANVALVRLGRNDLPALPMMLRPTGHLLPVWLAIPALVGLGALDALGRLPAWLAAVAVWSATPISLIHAFMFFRDWRAALDAE